MLNNLMKHTFSQILQIKIKVFINGCISSEIIKCGEMKQKRQFSVA